MGKIQRIIDHPATNILAMLLFIGGVYWGIESLSQYMDRPEVRQKIAEQHREQVILSSKIIKYKIEYNGMLGGSKFKFVYSDGSYQRVPPEIYVKFDTGDQFCTKDSLYMVYSQ